MPNTVYIDSVLGSDAYSYAQAQNVNTPWATITKLLASATTGDTAILKGDATTPYSYPGLGAGLFFNKIFTINCDVDYGAKITPNGATAEVVQLGSVASFTFGKVIIDAEGTVNHCITSNNSASLATTLNGTRLDNWIRGGYYGAGNIIATDASSTTTTAYTGTNPPCAAFYANATASTRIFTFTRPAINITHTGASGTVRGIWAKGNTDAIAGIAATSTGAVVNISSANAATQVFAVLLGNESGTGACATASITGTNFTSTGLSNTVQGVCIGSGGSSAIPTTSAIMENNVVTHSGSTPLSGNAVLVGNNINSQVHGSVPITGISFKNNSATNFSHGMMMGGVTGGICRSNTSTNCDQSVIQKNCLNSRSHSNKIVNPRPVALRFKASENCIIENNTIILDIDRTAPSSLEALLTALDDALPVTSINNIFRNNNVHIFAGGLIKRIILVAPDSVGTVTFSKNNYYYAGGTIDSAATVTFGLINSVNTTYATWTATETNATNVNDQMIGTTGKLPSTSPLFSSGVSITAGTTDFLDNPFRTPPTIGAFEFINDSGSGSSSGLIGKMIN